MTLSSFYQSPQTPPRAACLATHSPTGHPLLWVSPLACSDKSHLEPVNDEDRVETNNDATDGYIVMSARLEFMV